jgi:hypothetical protein
VTSSSLAQGWVCEAALEQTKLVRREGIEPAMSSLGNSKPNENQDHSVQGRLFKAIESPLFSTGCSIGFLSGADVEQRAPSPRIVRRPEFPTGSVVRQRLAHIRARQNSMTNGQE